MFFTQIPLILFNYQINTEVILIQFEKKNNGDRNENIKKKLINIKEI